MKQLTLAMVTGVERYTKKTLPALSLEWMEQVVALRQLFALMVEEALYDRLHMTAHSPRQGGQNVTLIVAPERWAILR